MKPILVLYATREGHTREIGEHVAGTLRSRGHDVEVRDLARHEPRPDLGACAAVILAASLHLGKHEREMVDFIKRNRAALERLPTAFLSASLAEAGAEDPAASEAARSLASAEVDECLEALFAATGWRPTRAKPVAGALLYTHYNFLVRFVMKRIAKRAGSTTDTSRDHDFTDWPALDRFVVDFASGLGAEPAPAHAASP